MIKHSKPVLCVAIEGIAIAIFTTSQNQFCKMDFSQNVLKD